MELVLYFLQLFRKNFSFSWTSVNLLFQNLCSPLKNFHTSVLNEVAYSVSFMISDDTLWTNIDLIIFTEVLSFLLRMLDTVLYIVLCNFAFLSVIAIYLVVFNLLKKMLCLFAIKTIKNCEVFNKLLDVWTEISAACRTGKYVAGSQIE